jgi:hypothetical protein
MIKLIWVDGRFPWPLIIAVGYLAVSLFVFDYIWRTTAMSFERLSVFLVLGNVTTVIAMALVWYLYRRKKA